MRTVSSDMPYARGKPRLRGRIRVRDEDFVVEEVLGFEPDGDGEHLLLLVEKVGANTDWVARQLAARAGVPARAVSYAGRKDRHALARQWFSIHLPGRPDPVRDELQAQQVHVLRAVRHRRKLRRGAHSGNRFDVLVRELSGDTTTLDAGCRRVAADGVPNYFGPQRYGRGGSNLRVARALFAGEPAPRGRNARNLALSAARSLLFDAVLAERVRLGSWNSLAAGDVANLAGSASWFPVLQVDEALLARLGAGDVHPTGPLWGRGELPSGAAVRALERAVVAREAALAAGLERSGLTQDRRALRVLPRGLRWQLEGTTVRLRLELPAGVFATSVLRELIDCIDAAGDTAPRENDERGP